MGSSVVSGVGLTSMLQHEPVWRPGLPSKLCENLIEHAHAAPANPVGRVPSDSEWTETSFITKEILDERLVGAEKRTGIQRVNLKTAVER